MFDGLDVELTEDLEKKVIQHRNNHYQLMIDRFFKALIQTIAYKDLSIQVDETKLEHLLRFGYDVAIGETSLGTITILGWSEHLPYDYTKFNFRSKIIKFLIPKEMQLKKYEEIKIENDCKTGNFIVVSNQEYYTYSDISIIKHYAKKLAEIESTRFSLLIQAKCLTYIRGDKNDEDVNKIVQKWYNGSPFLKLGKKFNVEDDIGSIENVGAISQLLTTTKEEYNTVMAELSQMVGINSFGIAKESGISSEEINANNELVLAMANIYIKSRQSSFNRLNKRYNKNIKVEYDNNKQYQRDMYKRVVDID